MTTTTTKYASTTVKSASSYQAYFFNLFQNYCCGPKARAGAVPTNKDFIPIPDTFRTRAKTIVDRINKRVFENVAVINRFTTNIPSQLLSDEKHQDTSRYVIDRIVCRIMNEARVINWWSTPKLYPIRTSGTELNFLLSHFSSISIGFQEMEIVYCTQY